jgi:hypothetical protein
MVGDLLDLLTHRGELLGQPRARLLLREQHLHVAETRFQGRAHLVGTSAAMRPADASCSLRARSRRAANRRSAVEARAAVGVLQVAGGVVHLALEGGG